MAIAACGLAVSGAALIIAVLVGSTLMSRGSFGIMLFVLLTVLLGSAGMGVVISYAVGERRPDR